MGVTGSHGAGGRRIPSPAAYFVALAGILGLLLLLCGYFLYYFIKKVLELRRVDTPTLTSPCGGLKSPLAPSVAVTAYPVQPVVRESASAMAKLCKQVPPPPAGGGGAGKGDTVFPTSTSPAAQRTDTGPLEAGAPPDKGPVLTVPTLTVNDVAAR